MSNMKKQRTYYIGLDIGTDSVGAAAIDERYRPLKYKGEPIMVSHLFDAANQCQERRSFRTARRRLDRRQQRVFLTDEIFAPEILKIDPDFYIRKKESRLYQEDKSIVGEKGIFFPGSDYSESMYYKEYPTIHHLLCDLISNKEKKFDLRLINIAVDWLMVHRGHFLSEAGKDNVDSVMDFNRIYEDFSACIDRMGKDMPWDRTDPVRMGEILKQKGVNKKKLELTDLLYDGKITRQDDYFMDKKELVVLMAGGKVKATKLFREAEFDEELSFGLSDDMELVLPQLGDYSELIGYLAQMHDWSVLSDILQGYSYISQAKVRIYEQHEKDLKNLKAFIKKNEKNGTYEKGTYYDVFRRAGAELKNYTAYSYNVSSVKTGEKNNLPKGKSSAEDFYSYLKKKLKLDEVICSAEDEHFLNDMKERINAGAFLPKQVDTDNRVIPYQLYWKELERIMENASLHYPFLKQRDSEGYSNLDKIESIFLFRIPYYVGPLVSGKKSPYAWMKRKSEGRIYPWNFENMVDFDASEQAFIDRMTNNCTYLPGESVLPKWSLLYSKFTVLNEINNITVNGCPITVDVKQAIYNDLFCRYARVTPKKIVEYMTNNGFMQKGDELGGLDESIKSCLKARYEFRHLLEKEVLNEDAVERIIERNTYTEEKSRFLQWLKREYGLLREEDIRYISKMRYSDFGRLSKRFLTGFEGADRKTGEIGSIMHFLWTTNDNLMKLLSDRYTFRENIEEEQKRYYEDHPQTVTAMLEDMGVSNAVKRPILRTLDVVKDIVSGLGCPPEKIFVEMARGEGEKKRTRSRLDQLRELYKSVEEDTRLLEKQLEEMGDTANNRLQSDALFLYYLQLGKCMYSGRPIDLSQIKSSKYNIDHIYPQSYVKDDSLLNNRVLVESEINGNKKDIYPIDHEIRSRMEPFWKMLCDRGLITKEKYFRLVRKTGFSEDEKIGFINRQLVETRQSTKVVTRILNKFYPDTKVVFVKANLAADFRKEFLFPKSRLVNDLHHAKDAYLNAVVGNVYYERFTKRWFSIDEKYSVKTKTLFTYDIKHEDKIIWDAMCDLNTVKKVYGKNSIHLTRYSYCKKGGFFDQMPVKKGNGQVRLKKNLDKSKYGGYNKTTASFFAIVKYKRGGKNEVSFIPVDLMASERFMNDDDFSKEYVRGKLEEINAKTIGGIEFPLGKRVAKIKSLLSIDGYRVWINGKKNSGRRIILSNAESLILAEENLTYVKKIESYLEKKKTNRNILHDPEYDGLSEERNLGLFMELVEKCNNKLYEKMPSRPYKDFINKREEFVSESFDEQIGILVDFIDSLKSGNGKKEMTMGANLSSSKVKSVYLMDVSPAGLHTVETINLMDLLK